MIHGTLAFRASNKVARIQFKSIYPSIALRKLKQAVLDPYHGLKSSEGSNTMEQ